MTLQTVGDLRAFLEDRGWSCEVLAQQVPVSNMTWRRLLEKADQHPIPPKYVTLLEKLEVSAAPPSAINPTQVVLSGMRQTKSEVLASLEDDGRAIRRPAPLLARVTARFRDATVPKRAATLLADLRRRFPTVSRSGQALILGGFAYFINPFDLIADTIPTVGFVDDIGVLLLIQSRLTRGVNKP